MGREGEREPKEAQLKKTKQGVRLRSRKWRRRSISHHTCIFSLSLFRPGRPLRAETSLWCSTIYGRAEAFQGESSCSHQQCVFIIPGLLKFHLFISFFF